LSVLRIPAFSFSSLNTPRPRSPETRPRQTHLVGKAATVAGVADPGRGAERLTERLFSRQTRTLGSGSRGDAETRRKSNLLPSALSAPPREKKCGWQTRTLGNGEETKMFEEGEYLGSRGAAELAEKIQFSSLRALRASA
jgi:hypothetical protein